MLDKTHKMANLRGRKLRIGSNVKQTMKRATAAKLRPPKSNNRSHRDTVGDGVSDVSEASSGRQCMRGSFKATEPYGVPRRTQALCSSRIRLAVELSWAAVSCIACNGVQKLREQRP